MLHQNLETAQEIKLSDTSIIKVTIEKKEAKKELDDIDKKIQQLKTSRTLTVDDMKVELKSLTQKKFAIPIRLRFMLHKMALQQDAEHPEKVPLRLVRMMWDYDLEYAKSWIAKWEVKKDFGETVLKNIEIYFSNEKLPDEMSFYQHSYYCFVLSTVMAGYAPDKRSIKREYEKDLKTMVYGVVRPTGEWSIKTELENQYFALRYISHVSKNGKIDPVEINYLSAWRTKKTEHFSGVRVLAIPCEEFPSFDGVKQMKVDGIKREVRALEDVKHDVIHAGFLRRHQEEFHNTPYFVERFDQMGTVIESVIEDKELNKTLLLKSGVHACLFMAFHEATTSIYNGGIPCTLPAKHYRTHGLYAGKPQVALSMATKSGLVPEVFKNEVKVEVAILDIFKIPLDALKKNPNLSPHQVVKEIIKALHPGYAYLHDKHAKTYDLSKEHYYFKIIQRTAKMTAHKVVKNIGMLFSKSASGQELEATALKQADEKLAAFNPKVELKRS